MARFIDGIFGRASGSLGNLVLSHRLGTPYFRTKPDKVHNPRTPKQEASRMKLGLMSKMISRFKPFLQVGFKDLPAGRSIRDVAYSANSKRVFKGEYPDIILDYSSVLVSNGPLESANDSKVVLEGQTLHFSWSLNAENGKPYTNHDIGMVLVYHEGLDSIVYSFRTTERSNKQFAFEIPDSMATSPDKLHCWITFISPDGKKGSESCYIKPV